MARRNLHIILILSLLILILNVAIGCSDNQVHTTPPDLANIPLKSVLGNGKPTLAEFGSSTCIPCKEMKPILQQLAVDYKGKVNVVIVEVYDQMDIARDYKIMTIPTQIIFDGDGNEVARHLGFIPREDIISQFKKMGIE